MTAWLSALWRPGKCKLQKGGQRERRWWIPYTSGAMKRHAVHVIYTGHIPPPENKTGPKAGFLGNHILLVPSSTSSQVDYSLRLFLLFIFTGYHQAQGGETRIM